MGCDAPVGWNQSHYDYVEKRRVEGFIPGHLGEPAECVRCRALVRRSGEMTHLAFHDELDRLQPSAASPTERNEG